MTLQAVDVFTGTPFRGNPGRGGDRREGSTSGPCSASPAGPTSPRPRSCCRAAIATTLRIFTPLAGAAVRRTPDLAARTRPRGRVRDEEEALKQDSLGGVMEPPSTRRDLRPRPQAKVAESTRRTATHRSRGGEGFPQGRRRCGMVIAEVAARCAGDGEARMSALASASTSSTSPA